MPDENDGFFEEDEDVNELLAAFEAGPQVVTGDGEAVQVVKASNLLRFDGQRTPVTVDASSDRSRELVQG